MKFLPLLFFVGLSLTSAKRLSSQDLGSLVDNDEVNVLDGFAVREDKEVTSEVSEKLREILDKVLERLINFLDEEQVTVEDGLETLVERLKELKRLLQERREELGARGQKILERIRERLQELRDRLRRRLREIFGSSAYADVVPAKEDTTSEVAQRLRKILNRILNRIFSYLDDRKVSTEDNLETLVEGIKEIGQILRQRREELGDRGKKILLRIRERIQELRQRLGRKLSEIFGIDSGSDALYAEAIPSEEEDTSSEVAEKLREILDGVLERFVKFFDEKEVTVGDRLETLVERVKELRRILRERREELGVRGKQILERIRQRIQELRDRLNRRLREIFAKGSSSAYADVVPAEEVTTTEVAERLKEILDRILDRIIRYLDDRKVSAEDNLETLVQRIKEIGQILRQRKEELGVRGKQILERIRERIQELRQRLGRKLREIFGIDTRSDILYAEDVVTEEDNNDSEIVQRLREALERVVERIRLFIDEGKVTADDVFERLVERVRKLTQQLRYREDDLKVRGSDILNEVKGKLRELRDKWERKLRQIFGLDSRSGGIYVNEAQSEEENEESKTLRERFEEIVRRIKDALENGRSVKDALEQLRELRQKLRENRTEFQEKMKEVIERLREKVREWLRKIFGNNDYDERRSDSLRENLRRLRQWIVDEFNVENLETKVAEIFGKRSEVAERILNKLGGNAEQVRQRILKFLNRLLGKNEEKRSLKDTYERIREFFEDLAIRMKEKYLKFGEWAKTKYDEGLEKGRNQVERIRALAREYINDLKIIGKDVRDQGYEFFREYKEDLKTIWEDIQGKIQAIRSRE